MNKHFGSFTLVVEADNEDELKNKMDILFQSLSELNDTLKPLGIDISGFEDSEEKW